MNNTRTHCDCFALAPVGAAYAYRQYLSGCDEGTYLGAESQAERYRQGVWQWRNEVKPWDFRKGN